MCQIPCQRLDNGISHPNKAQFELSFTTKPPVFYVNTVSNIVRKVAKAFLKANFFTNEGVSFTTASGGAINKFLITYPGLDSYWRF